MRKLVFATAAILSMASASAAPIGNAAAGRLAPGSFERAERVACWSYGWRGYGWYPEWNAACWGPQLLGFPDGDPPIYAAPRGEPPPYTPPFDDVRRCWVPDDGRTPGHWRRC